MQLPQIISKVDSVNGMRMSNGSEFVSTIFRSTYSTNFFEWCSKIGMNWWSTVMVEWQKTTQTATKQQRNLHFKTFSMLKFYKKYFKNKCSKACRSSFFLSYRPYFKMEARCEYLTLLQPLRSRAEYFVKFY
jgi:hypothetical protein